MALVQAQHPAHVVAARMLELFALDRQTGDTTKLIGHIDTSDLMQLAIERQASISLAKVVHKGSIHRITGGE
jgi:hypothetical protein